MKIKKINESLLREDDKEVPQTQDEPILAEVDPQTAPISEIADAIQASVETSTQDEKTVPDANAIVQATEIKKTAQEVDAGAAEIIPSKEDYDDIIIDNRLIGILDDALTSAKRFMNKGIKAGANVLIEGLPGSGKTAIVENWAQVRGLKLVAVNATDPKLETAINGMPLRDVSKPDENAVTIARSDLLNDLLDPQYAGKCVLFVDEFNRQQNQQLRRVFLSIFNEKRNANGSLDFSKNLLFTVVCINPAGAKYKDKGTDQLNQAERSRFVYDITDFDSKPEESWAYFDQTFNKRLLALGVIVPDSKAATKYDKYGPYKKLTDADLADIDEELKIHDLAKYILNDKYHPNVSFAFDSRDDLADLSDYNKQLLNARKLTDLLENAEGDRAKFLKLVDNTSNLLDKDKEMFHAILDSYILDLPELRKEVGIGLTEDEIAAQKEKKEAESNKEEDSISIEDDDTLFAKTTSGKVAIDPNSVENIINAFANNL